MLFQVLPNEKTQLEYEKHAVWMHFVDPGCPIETDQRGVVQNGSIPKC
ncbi:hypothetical protein FHS27_003725 [Rhodopirellula rubra]|uniref:Uncharacterized protein n=1 Tax=Aporhodopirellula rubra TaxID=980271 RepID=A0A7W5E1D7_9BACT|nr:hypothetical protein [Aporhodopirellula rubra]MBB3207898.1 hypothetical protein [Aporhodopirellula rubra]